MSRVYNTHNVPMPQETLQLENELLHTHKYEPKHACAIKLFKQAEEIWSEKPQSAERALEILAELYMNYSHYGRDDLGEAFHDMDNQIEMLACRIGKHHPELLKTMVEALKLPDYSKYPDHVREDVKTWKHTLENIEKMNGKRHLDPEVESQRYEAARNLFYRAELDQETRAPRAIDTLHYLMVNYSSRGRDAMDGAIGRLLGEMNSEHHKEIKAMLKQTPECGATRAFDEYRKEHPRTTLSDAMHAGMTKTNDTEIKL